MELQTTTVSEAWQESCNHGSMQFGHEDNHFAVVGWKSPSTGQLAGPFLVTISGDQCIEIGWNGCFRKAYPATTKNYFSWITRTKDSTDSIRNAVKFAQSILERI